MTTPPRDRSAHTVLSTTSLDKGARVPSRLGDLPDPQGCRRRSWAALAVGAGGVVADPHDALGGRASASAQRRTRPRRSRHPRLGAAGPIHPAGPAVTPAVCVRGLDVTRSAACAATTSVFTRPSRLLDRLLPVTPPETGPREGATMRVNRREALGLGALGALGALGLSVPLGAGAQAKSASRLASRQHADAVHDRLRPRRRCCGYQAMSDAERPVPPLHGHPRRRLGPTSCPGSATPVYGYNGSVPGPDDPGPAGHARQAARAQPAAGGAPEVRAPVQHLDAPARLGVPAAVRRVRQRRDASWRLQGLLVPELAAGAHPLVPRPQRA